MDKVLAKVAAPFNPRKQARSEEQTDLRSFFCPKVPPANTVVGDSSASQSHTTDASLLTDDSSQLTSNTSQASLPTIMALAVLLASLEPNHLRSQGAGSGEVLPAGTGTHTLPDCSSAVKGNFTEGAATMQAEIQALQVKQAIVEI